MGTALYKNENKRTRRTKNALDLPYSLRNEGKYPRHSSNLNKDWAVKIGFCVNEIGHIIEALHRVEGAEVSFHKVLA